MNGYLDAISNQQTTFSLNGREISLPRARLGLHLQLGRVLSDFEQAPGWLEIASAIRSYFGLLGVDITGAHPVEVLATFAALREFNAWQWFASWQKDRVSSNDTQELPYTYPGRGWVVWIHMLASRYGWTRHYILNELYPEEAAMYIQEILLSEQFESEERHSLSELAYRYDSVSKTSRYVPLQKPAWMLPVPTEPKPVRMLKSMLPYGVWDMAGKEILYH